MAENDTYQLAQIAAGAAAGLIAVAVFAQKFLNSWKSDRTEGSIIHLMHTELERLAEQNAKLSEELGKLQTEIIELNKELRALTTENQQLHSEVRALTAEVSRLQRSLQGTVNGRTS